MTRRMSILDLLGLGRRRRADEDTDAVHRIARELDAMEPAVARHLALFAFLLARVANVDLEMSEAETREMARAVETYGGLPPAQAALVVEIAKSQNRLFGETHNFLAARELRDVATDAQKRELLHCLFAVSAADDSVSVAEEEAVRAVARELLLTNDEYLAIRSAYRDKRAVLRREG
jgi:uncharacterized tellurite resistance protein B-like protein